MFCLNVRHHPSLVNKRQVGECVHEVEDLAGIRKPDINYYNIITVRH